MTATSGRTVLLTGATGFLGKVVLYDLLRRREALGIDRIHLVIRPKGGSDAEARLRSEIFESPALAGLPPGWESSLSGVSADLGEAGALESASAGIAPRLSQIIHCAASVEFDLPLAEASRANVESALQVLELAKDCEGLHSLVSVSTAYVTAWPGRGVAVEERLAPLPRPAAEILAAIRSGRASEASLLRETGHPNTYTLTKCLAEHLLAENRGKVPLSLVRPSIISASWRRPTPGWIDSPAAFALFVMAIGTGRMRAVVARPESRIDVVPCDEVSERVVVEAFRDGPRADLSILHAVAGYEQAISIQTCREGLHAWFQRNPVSSSKQGAAEVHYLGPRGLRYRYHHWRHHQRQPGARLLAGRIDQTNRRFAYFTQNSFHFQSSVPMRLLDFEPRRYVERVCRGVAEHLLDADLQRVSIGGAKHPRALPLPYGGRLGELDAKADRITFDLLSFERVLELRAGGRSLGRLVLVPNEDGPWNDALLELLVWSRSDLWVAPPRVARAERGSAVARPWDELQVRIEHAPSEKPGDGLGRFHLSCAGLIDVRPEERPAETVPSRPRSWLQEQAD